MPTYRLSIITPNGKVFDDQIDSLIACGTTGSFGVWARHAPMVASLAKGPLTIKRDGKESYFAVGPGILEVNAERDVLLLADAAVGTDTLGQETP